MMAGKNVISGPWTPIQGSNGQRMTSETPVPATATPYATNRPRDVSDMPNLTGLTSPTSERGQVNSGPDCVSVPARRAERRRNELAVRYEADVSQHLRRGRAPRRDAK